MLKANGREVSTAEAERIVENGGTVTAEGLSETATVTGHNISRSDDRLNICGGSAADAVRIALQNAH